MTEGCEEDGGRGFASSPRLCGACRKVWLYMTGRQSYAAGMSISRRRFLHLVGVAGGSSAAYQAALGLGLIPLASAAKVPDIAPLPKGTRQSVLILGAGLAGLVAAY